MRRADGSFDFGEIPEEIARAIGREAGPIRLPKGKEKSTGELHMIRGGKANDLRAAGYDDVGELVDEVGLHFNEIWEGTGNSIILVKRGEGRMLVRDGERETGAPTIFLELRGAGEVRAWEVKSGGVYRNEYTDGKNLLWHGERNPATAAGSVPLYTVGP